MTEDAQNTFTVTVVPDKQIEQKPLTEDGITSNSSNFSTDGSNVSFVNVTYTIQPRSIRSLCKKFPSKIILDNVRYVSMYIYYKPCYTINLRMYVHGVCMRAC